MKKETARFNNGEISVYKDGEVTPYKVVRHGYQNPEFVEYLRRMSSAQVRDHYVGGKGDTLKSACGENYSDVIEGRIYELTDQLSSYAPFHRVLSVNSRGQVLAQYVYYTEPVTILTLP